MPSFSYFGIEPPNTPSISSIPYSDPLPDDLFKPVMVNLMLDIEKEGDEVHVYKVLDIVEEKGWTLTIFVTGEFASNHPDIIKDFNARGHEIGISGWDNQDINSLSYENQLDLISRSITAVKQALEVEEFDIHFKPSNIILDYDNNADTFKVMQTLNVKSIVGIISVGENYQCWYSRSKGGIYDPVPTPYNVNAIPISRIEVNSEETPVVDDLNLISNKYTELTSPEFQKVYQEASTIEGEVFEGNTKPYVRTVLHSSELNTKEKLEDLSNFLNRVEKAEGQVEPIGIYASIQGYITTLDLKGPDSSYPDKSQTLNITYYANLYCPWYYFRIYGKYDSQNWKLLGQASYYVTTGTKKFQKGITVPKPPTDADDEYNVRIVGRACAGAACWPSYNNYENMDEIKIKINKTCQLVFGSGNAARYDIVFVPAEFDEAEFDTTFAAAVTSNWNAIGNAAPFSASKNKFNVWKVNKLDDAGLNCHQNCSGLPAWASSYWCCNKAKAKALASECKNRDTVITLIDSTDWTGYRSGPRCTTGGDLIVKARNNPAINLHEMGHAFGLGDEYVPYNQNFTPAYAPCDNCDKNSACPKWNASPSCIMGCTYRNDYRSTATSVMRDNQLPFNAVSVTHLNAELTAFSSAEVRDVGDLDEPEIKTYILSFIYHVGNDSLALEDKEVRETYPDENDTDGTYRYEIISLSETSLYSANFVDPYLVTDSVTLLESSLTPPEDFVINDTPIPDYPPPEAPSQEFVLITPFFFDAETINIYDENNSLKLSIDVSEFMSGDLTGVIKDPTGNPVVNAIVYAIQDNYNYSSSSYTNTNGTYAMRGLGSGTASIRVTALHDLNLREASTSFTIVPGQRNLLNITLAQSSSISGTVTYLNGTGMPNPILYLEYYEAPRYTGDENGSYLMPWLTQGAHTLNIDTGNWYIWVNNDYTSYGRNTPLNIILGETTTVDFSQQPPPTFNDITISPQYPNVNTDITVSANITSEYVNITEARLFYRYNTSAWNNLTMQNTGDIYSAAVPGNENTSRVSFYIAVTDSSGRRKSNINKFIIDGESPTLAGITVPQFADVNESITINANFQDNVGLAAATLYYQFDAGSFNPVAMTVVGNSSSGTIPQKNTPGTVELYIQSTDLSGNSFNTSAYYYIVKRFGRLEPYLITPSTNIPVSRSHLFNFSSGVRCVGGECGNITSILDPYGPDGFNYTALNSTEEGGDPFEWEEIITNGEGIPLWDIGQSADDSYQTAPINFTFQFYGINYTNAYVSSNGRIHLTNSGAGSTSISLPSNSYKVIAPLNRDMYVRSNTQVFYKNYDNPKRMVIEYKNLDYYSGIGNFNYEIILYEDGKIKIQYNQSSSSYAPGNQAGINHGSTNNYYLLIENDAPDLHKGEAVTFYPPYYSGMWKGVIPMNNGTPFYTIDQNPASCYNMQENDICEHTWRVNATGEHLSNWTFFTIYNSQYTNHIEEKQTDKINITIIGNNLPIISSVECQENNSIWQDCSNIIYNDLLTRVRVNCTDSDGTVTNVNAKLENIPDNNIFFNSSSVQNGDWWTYDNADITIQDSGYWKLSVSCTDNGGVDGIKQDNKIIQWLVDWGHLSSYMAQPIGNNLSVKQSIPFSVTTGVSCIGGECGSIESALDPQGPIRVAVYNHNGITSVLNEALDINATQVSTYNSATLENYDVLINVRNSNLNQADVLNFIQNGGGWVGEWTSNEIPVTNWGAISGTLSGSGTSGSQSVNILLPNHYLATEIDWANIPVGANPVDYMRDLRGINDPDAETVVTVNHNSYPNNPLIVDKGYGTGRIVLLNWDYQDSPNYNAYIKDMIQETVRWAATMGKGVIPMNNGTPFYTTNQNPALCVNMIAGDVCEHTWNVMPIGEDNTTWDFFTIYTPLNYSAYLIENRTRTVKVIILTNPPPAINQLECNDGSSWQSCSNIQYNDTLTQVRVNCTDADGYILSANLSLKNIQDSNIFFNNAATQQNGWWTYDNTDLLIEDSGDWKLTAICTDNESTQNSGSADWLINWGHLESYFIEPLENISIMQNKFFNVTTRVRCIGGECGNVSTALDPESAAPEEPNLNKASDKIETEIIEDLDTEDTVSVIVILKDEEPSQKSMPEIKAKVKENQDTVLSNLETEEFDIKYKYNTINAISGEATEQGIEKLKDNPNVEAVYKNQELRIVLSESVPLINADDLHSLGITGEGQTVCVVDTGIDYAHPDLGGCTQSEFLNGQCAKVPSGYDFYNSDTNPMDDQSHGTHVAGIVAANGVLTGVAPNARLLALKVCSSGGSCNGDAMIAGVDWCNEHKDQYNIVATTMSIGDGGQYNTNTCPTWMDTAITTAHDLGIAVTIASGNEYHSNGISYPGCSPNAISVGSTTKADVISGFSNTGSLLDVLAPGSSIYAPILNGGYGYKSGTSMATPHVAGAVALLSQYSNPSGVNQIAASPDRIKEALQNTGVPITDPDNGLSFPRIDLLAALDEFGKGIIPMNNGTPFYTIDQNPTTCQDMKANDECDRTWSIMPTGEENTTWDFFTIYTPTTYSNYLNGTETNKVSITILGAILPQINQLECNDGSSWQSCSNIQYNDILDQVRVNCTTPNGSIVSANLNLKNIQDNNIFFDSTATQQNGWWTYDNTDFIIEDSGDWKLTAACVDHEGIQGDGHFDWLVDWGHLQPYLINPTQSTNVNQNQFFNVSTGVRCITGECGDIDVTLDPEEMSIEPIDVLIVSADSSVDTEVRNKILTAGGSNINSVAIFNAQYGTPTLIQLQNYSVVLTYSNYPYSSSTALGKVLAEYVNNSGGVVVTVFSHHLSTWGITGQWLSGQYNPILQQNSYTSGTVYQGTVYEPGHPIMNGGDNINGGWYFQTSSITPNAIRVMDWTNEYIGAAVKEINSGKVVGLNLRYGETTTSDGADLLLVNSLLWVAGRSGSAKGVIPMNNGTPFYTIDQNPAQCPDMRAGNTCEHTWRVNATGDLNSSWLFYTIYNSIIATNTTEKFNVTIVDTICTPDWVLNDTWSTCDITDNQFKNYYDANNCDLPEARPGHINQTCDYCTPAPTYTSWSAWENQGSCLINDTQLQQRNRTEYDADYDSCYAVTNLNSDLWNNGNNNTHLGYQGIACDYCTPIWEEVINECQPDDTYTGWYNDTNDCYAITGLDSDNNPPANNIYNCEYIWQFQAPLNQDWNLISIPLTLSNNSFSSALSSIEGKYNTLFAYDSIGNSWDSYYTDEPEFLNSIYSISPEKGYWVNLLEDATLTFSGRLITQLIYNLKNDWNLISYPSLTEQPVTTALADVNETYTTMFAFINGTWISYSPEKPSFMNSLEIMKPGYGYWIKANQDVTWVFNGTVYKLRDQ